MTIRVGIAGYGNLGRGVESAISQNKDMELVGVFTRRNPEDVKLLNGNVSVHMMDDIHKFTDAIDVLILCGGSKNDLPEQGPALSALFNTVDSFDTHAKIPGTSNRSMHLLNRMVRQQLFLLVGIQVYFPSIVFTAKRFYQKVRHTRFGGKDLSQGHSDAAQKN